MEVSCWLLHTIQDNHKDTKKTQNFSLTSQKQQDSRNKQKQLEFVFFPCLLAPSNVRREIVNDVRLRDKIREEPCHATPHSNRSHHFYFNATASGAIIKQRNRDATTTRETLEKQIICEKNFHER